MKLSVLIPAYNEERWLRHCVQRVLGQKIDGVREKEIIVVDDCSSDGTGEIIRELEKSFRPDIRAFYHEQNAGKGAALRTAVENMTGDICIIQDADLEYDPEDYPLMLEPIIDGRADCVYGSRFVGTQSKRVLFFWHYVGNKLLTLMSNVFTNLNLTDMETGYKAFRCDLLKAIPLRSNRFGVEPEVTAKIARRRCRIYEVGVSYSGRTYDEGKKITWRDGFQAICVILKYWIVNDSVKAEETAGQ